MSRLNFRVRHGIRTPLGPFLSRAFHLPKPHTMPRTGLFAVDRKHRTAGKGGHDFGFPPGGVIVNYLILLFAAGHSREVSVLRSVSPATHSVSLFPVGTSGFPVRSASSGDGTRLYFHSGADVGAVLPHPLDPCPAAVASLKK